MSGVGGKKIKTPHTSTVQANFAENFCIFNLFTFFSRRQHLKLLCRIFKLFCEYLAFLTILLGTYWARI